MLLFLVVQKVAAVFSFVSQSLRFYILTSPTRERKLFILDISLNVSVMSGHTSLLSVLNILMYFSQNHLK